MDKIRNAKYQIGQVVRHRLYPFRGVVFDIDPIFDNTEEWYEAIPADVRPHKDQPFYHLFAENDDTEYVAYVSEQNLLPDESGEPVRHPQSRKFSSRTARAATAPAHRRFIRYRHCERSEAIQSREIWIASSLVIGPATSGRTRWLPAMTLECSAVYCWVGAAAGAAPGAGGAFEDCGWPPCCSSFLRASSARRCSSSCNFCCCSSNTLGSVGGPS